MVTRLAIRRQNVVEQIACVNQKLDEQGPIQEEREMGKVWLDTRGAQGLVEDGRMTSDSCDSYQVAGVGLQFKQLIL